MSLEKLRTLNRYSPLLLPRSCITRANFRRTKFEKAEFKHTSPHHFVVRIVHIQRSANFEAMELYY